MKYKLPLSLVSFLCLLYQVAFAQSFSTIWQKGYAEQDEGAITGLLQSTNGMIIAAGHTTLKTKGDRDGLLLLIDAGTGALIRRLAIGGSKEDGFTDVIQTFDGAYLLAGYTYSIGAGGSDAWLVKVDEEGNILWERSFGQSDDEAFSRLILLPDGHVLAAGQKKAQTGAWLMEIVDGERRWETRLGEGRFGTVDDMCLGINGEVLITGRTAPGPGVRKGSIWLAAADQRGSLEWERIYETRIWDGPTALLETFDRQHLLAAAGWGKFADETDIWLMELGEEGQLAREHQIGGADEERIGALAQSFSGDLFLAGATKSHIRRTRYFNGYMVRMSGEGERTAEHPGEGKNDLFHDLITLYDGSLLAGGFRNGERSETGEPWLVKLDPPRPAVTASKALPGDHGADILCSDVQFFDADKNGLLTPGERGYFLFKVTNNGPLPVRGLTVSVEAVPELEGLSYWTPVNIPTLAPRQVKQVTVPVIGKTNLQTGKVDFELHVTLGGRKLKMLRSQVETKGLSPGQDLKPLPRSEITLFWERTAPERDPNGEIRTSNPVFEFQLKAASNKRLTMKDFKVYIGGVVLEASKDANSRLDSLHASGQYLYTYANRIPLTRGNNTVRVEIVDVDGNVSSQPVDILYEPSPPDLFLLAVGPVYENPAFTLQYVPADAADFADAFRGQEGLLFSRIHPQVLNRKASTTTLEIRKAVKSLENRYLGRDASGQLLDDNDVILLFVSSHGIRKDDRFFLLPSDYDPNFEDITTIDYQKDVVDVLNRIPCKKIVFIDACHSGQAKGGKSPEPSASELGMALDLLSRKITGATVIASCGPEERSYEHEAWQNSAFTEAILEAFSDRTRADVNANDILTLDELFRYLQRRVPDLVREKIAEGLMQVPSRPRNDFREEDIPLFIFK